MTPVLLRGFRLLRSTKNCSSGTFCSITDLTKLGTAAATGEVNISALRWDHRSMSLLSMFVQVSLRSLKQLISLPTKIITVSFPLTYISSSWNNPSPLLSVLPTMQLGNTLFSWGEVGGSRWGSGRRWRRWGFFFPTTAFYSVQRSISSLLFFSTVQHTIFSTPPIVLTAFFRGLSSWCAFSLKYHAPNRRLTQQQPYQCCAECITSHASQALCQLMNPKTIFGVVWFFFLSLSICIQPATCKRMQVFLWKAATWPSLLLFLVVYHSNKLW